MEKEFVPYELSVKLKPIGFDEECFGYYHVNVGYTKGYAFCYFDKPKRFKDGFDLLAPTFSQAFRWFREKYGYWSYVKEARKGTCRFYIEKFDEKFFNSDIIDSYEEAELACLTKLIEIVKNK